MPGKKNKPDTKQVKAKTTTNACRAKASDLRITPDNRFPVIGLGASAGGLQALRSFFSEMSGIQLQQPGQITEPEPGNPLETESVLSPAAVRGPDGKLYVFPQLVAKGNCSRVIRYRSPEPVLTPQSPEELRGTIANVVFPTGIDRRDDLGSPDRFDIYYGMADNRIGAAHLDVPDHLPPGALADGDGPKTGGQE